jgi:hypothetical protein
MSTARAAKLAYLADYPRDAAAAIAAGRIAADRAAAPREVPVISPTVRRAIAELTEDKYDVVEQWVTARMAQGATA